VANTWKTTYKLNPSWESLTNAINKQIGLELFSGSGGWNDAGNMLSALPVN
jgi:alpha-galactosidase